MDDREDDPNGIIPETVEIELINRWSAFHYHYNAKSSDTIEMLKLHYQNAFKVSAQHLYFFSKTFLLVMAYLEERTLCKNKKEQDQNPDIVQIKFKRFLNFSEYYYEAKRSDTVGMLKLHYQKAFRIPEQHLCFYSKWSELENHQRLSFYGLRGFAEVNVYLPEDRFLNLMLAISLTNILIILLLVVAFFMELRTQ